MNGLLPPLIVGQSVAGVGVADAVGRGGFERPAVINLQAAADRVAQGIVFIPGIGLTGLGGVSQPSLCLYYI